MSSMYVFPRMWKSSEISQPRASSSHGFSAPSARGMWCPVRVRIVLAGPHYSSSSINACRYEARTPRRVPPWERRGWGGGPPPEGPRPPSPRGGGGGFRGGGGTGGGARGLLGPPRRKPLRQRAPG